MRYAVLITSAPEQVAFQRGYLFCQALLEQGHTLSTVFFSQSALGLFQSHAPSDEWQPLLDWQRLQQAQAPTLVYQICSAFAARHNLSTLPTGFELAGLGSWTQAALDSDRVVVFPQADTA